MAIARAKYIRDAATEGFSYALEPVTLKPFYKYAQLALRVVVAFLVAALGGAILSQIVHFPIGLPVFLVAFPLIFRKVHFDGKLGRRKPANITLNKTELRMNLAGQNTVLPRKDIRRLRIINVYDDHGGGDGGSVVAIGGGLQAAGTMAIGEIGRKRDIYYTSISFGVAADHGNESTVLIDGIDEITARNFSDDLLRDMGS